MNANPGIMNVYEDVKFLPDNPLDKDFRGGEVVALNNIEEVLKAAGVGIGKLLTVKALGLDRHSPDPLQIKNVEKKSTRPG